MPVFNVTGEYRVFTFSIPELTDYGSQVPDSSPLILYSGSWDDTPKSTTDYQLYQNQTYHLSSQHVCSALWPLQVSHLRLQGDTATLAFNGSGIYIFGSRKPEYVCP